MGVEKELWRYGSFCQILEEKSYFQKTMFWYVLHCVEPSLRLLKNRKCPRPLGPVSILSGYLHSYSQVRKVSVCGR